MKTHNLKPFYIISAHQPDRDNNVTAHCLEQDLAALELPSIEATGVYKGEPESSRIVFSDDEIKAKFLRDEYKQECYLYVHNDRTAELVYPDGTRKSLVGTFRLISPDFIGQHQNYTKVGEAFYAVY